MENTHYVIVGGRKASLLAFAELWTERFWFEPWLETFRSWARHFTLRVPLCTHNHCHKSLAHTHPLSHIQCWKAQFVRTPCELALLRFVNKIERVGAGGRLK